MSNAIKNLPINTDYSLDDGDNIRIICDNGGGVVIYIDDGGNGVYAHAYNGNVDDCARDIADYMHDPDIRGYEGNEYGEDVTEELWENACNPNECGYMAFGSVGALLEDDGSWGGNVEALRRELLYRIA